MLLRIIDIIYRDKVKRFAPAPTYKVLAVLTLVRQRGLYVDKMLHTALRLAQIY